MATILPDQEAIRFRLVPLLAAWLVCWLIWVTALTWLAFDGVIFLLIQALLATVMTSFATTVSFMTGEYIRTTWKAPRSSWLTVCLVFLLGSAAVLADGKHLGFAHTYTDPDTHAPFIGLSQLAFLAGFFVLNFAIANWPMSKPSPPPRAGR
jgi:hypothetical protein